MDDSDQDFVDLCSKLLKRGRRKAGETASERKTKVAEPWSQAPTKDVPPSKRQAVSKKNNAGITFRGALGRSVKTQTLSTSTACDHQTNLVPSNTDNFKQAVITEVSDGGTSHRAKDKVLHRMQQFKRVSPQKLVHVERSPLSETENVSDTLPQRPEPSTSAFHHSHPSSSTPVPLDPLGGDSDEALALRLQEELDREVQAGVVDLELGGLFFCQLCQRDLSVLSPTGRTQHINRCLDESEESTAPPRVPECPICGKRFKSPKSRTLHLKRCSSTMGVAPALLLQAVQRQAAEGLTDNSTSQPLPVGGTKRKGPKDPRLPARKKSRKRPRGLDEDTLVALALSNSLLEQEREREMQRGIEVGLGQQHPTPLIDTRVDTSKGRGKRKKGVASRPPPLLLVQDPEAALRRLQERVTTLLLCSRVPSPPTPTRCPSSLPACGGAARLWQKSALLGGGSKAISEFYTPELRDIVAPWLSGKAEPGASTETQSTIRQSTPITEEKQLPSTAEPGHLPVGSQALCDLMELAEEGMTLTQWGYSAPRPGKDRRNSITDVRLSGFVPEITDHHEDICLSGFIPERRDTEECGRKSVTEHADSDQKSVALSRLASDLTSMVNNPQLSDVQLQVDTGEVYYAHSFMLYARCPLLAQMVHDSGFGVQEEGVPQAQRVLMGDVAGKAVWSLLQYLYTACCPPLSHSLLPHLQELAIRFDLKDLRQLCELQPRREVTQGEREVQPGVDYPAREGQSGSEEEHRDQVFMELLRSMWNEGNEEDEGQADGEEEGGMAGGEREDGVTLEDQVNEDEMEEIYEFAASQRKRDEGQEQSDEEEEEGVSSFTEPEEREGLIGGQTLAEREQVIPIRGQTLAEREQVIPIRGQTLAEKEQMTPLKASLLAEHPFSAINIHTTTFQSHITIETEIDQSEGTEPEDATRAAVGSNGAKQSDRSVTSLREVLTDLSHPSRLDRELDLKASLDRSYSRLFSDSWGVYDSQTDPPSSLLSPPRATPKTSCSQPPRTTVDVVMTCPNPTNPPSHSQPSEMNIDGRTPQPEIPILQASGNEIVDLSISPPMVPVVSTLPIPDWSPGNVTDAEGRGRTEGPGRGKGDVVVMATVCKSLFKKTTQSSQGDRKVPSQGLERRSASPSPHSRHQPELIVLSDSSDEMDLGDLAPTGSPSTSPTPLSCLSQKHLDYTRIRIHSDTMPKNTALRNIELEPETPILKTQKDTKKLSSRTQPDPDPKESTLKEKETSSDFVGVQCISSLGKVVDTVPPVSGSSPGSAHLHLSQIDCSAEMSWLIPATPPVVLKRNTSSSTQTFSSMRRTKLFPKNNFSVSSAPSSFALPSKLCRQTSTTSDPPNSAQAECSVSRRVPQSSSLGLGRDDRSFRKYPSDAGSSDQVVELTDRSPVFVINPCQTKQSLIPSVSPRPSPDPSTKETPLPDVPQPYSSTPLHAHLPKPPAPSLASMASPLLRDTGGKSKASQGGRKWESKSPGKKGIHASSPDIASPSLLTESSGSPCQRRPSIGSEYFHGSGDKQTEVNGEGERGTTGRSNEPMEMEELERSVVKSGEREHEEMSFLESEEPAMAFDDSWGLNGGGEPSVEQSQQVCFSLRLESSSGGGSPPELVQGGGHSQTRTTQPCTSPSTPQPTTSQDNPEINASLLYNPEMWDDWGEEEVEEALPLSQRVKNVALAKRVAQLKTPVRSKQKGHQGPLVPITPMPSYSDMDTPDLKNKLSRFGVRPLPKRQMILKLKEIHQYTHQVISFESEDEAPSLGLPQPTKVPARLVSCVPTGGFREPGVTVPPSVSPVKLLGGDEEVLSASQGSNTSSTAPSEDSERSNPEQCLSDDDSESDSAVTASQAVSSLQERLVAVRRFIQSDPRLYGQILQYQPLVLSDLQVRLKAAGIRLGAAKLLDYLDSQCITFTTAKPRGGGERKGRGRGRRGLPGGTRRRGRRGGANVLD